MSTWLGKVSGDGENMQKIIKVSQVKVVEFNFSYLCEFMERTHLEELSYFVI